MMNKSLLAAERESSSNRIYGFQPMGTQNSLDPQKMSRRCRRL
jgi:hypothetical protein